MVISQIRNIIPGRSKYLDCYFKIISKAKKSNRKKDGKNYYEVHHILPKSLWSKFKNQEWNQVTLTAREHYIVHKLLLKHFEKLCWTIQKPIHTMKSKNSRAYLKKQIKNRIEFDLDLHEFENNCKMYDLNQLCILYNTSKRKIKSTARSLEIRLF